MSRLAYREMWISTKKPEQPTVWACHKGALYKAAGWHRLRISNRNRSWSGTVDGVLYVVPFESHPGFMQRIGDAALFAHDGYVPPAGDKVPEPKRVLVTLEELFAEDEF